MSPERVRFGAVWCAEHQKKSPDERDSRQAIFIGNEND
jgi:hypothetical protein